MSNQSNQKVYAKGIYINKKLISGKELFEMSCNVDQFVAFLQQYRDEKGYVRIACWPKREADKYGTHNAELNTWKPNSNQGDSLSPQKEDLPF